MSLRDALSGLPDEAQVTLKVGWIREQLSEPEETPKGSDPEDEIVRMAVRECMKNFSGRVQCQSASGRTHRASGASTT